MVNELDLLSQTGIMASAEEIRKTIKQQVRRRRNILILAHPITDDPSEKTRTMRINLAPLRFLYVGRNEYTALRLDPDARHYVTLNEVGEPMTYMGLELIECRNQSHLNITE